MCDKQATACWENPLSGFWKAYSIGEAQSATIAITRLLL